MALTGFQRNDMIVSGLNLIKQAISWHDEDLRLIGANRRFQEMFNLPDRMVRPGAEFKDIVSYLTEMGEYGQVDDIPAFVDEKVRLAFTFEPHYFERTRSNGTAISVEGSPFQEGGWISVYTDITESKRQEAFIRSHAESLSEELVAQSEDLARANRTLSATVNALQVTKQELTDSREQLALMNRMTPAHIAHVNAAGVYTHSNGKLPTVLPVADGNIVGQSFEDVLGSETWSRVSHDFSQVLTGVPTTSEIRDPASGRSFRLAMTPDLSAEQGVQGAYILSMDVTEEVTARAALAHARRRELAAQITSGMALDFANLLTIILGQQDQLEALAHKDPKLESIAATIKSAAKRGGALIDSLSGLVEQRRLNPVAVDIASFVHNLRPLAQAAVAERVDLTVNLTVPDARLTFDPGFAQDTVLNLVLNAAEAQSGQARITVDITRASDGTLEIAVQDDGPGFTEEGLANGLAPFYSTKRGKAGRGLGLSSAFDFAKASGGTLKLRNRPDGGALVSLRIPYSPVRTVRSGLVLLVDDTIDVRQNVRAYLRRAGLAVVEATSVEDAQKLIALEGLTHIVTDLAMGDGTGLDVLDNAPPDLPCLIITGLPGSDPLRKSAEARHQVLSKPFDYDTFEAAFLKASA